MLLPLVDLDGEQELEQLAVAEEARTAAAGEARTAADQEQGRFCRRLSLGKKEVGRRTASLSSGTEG